MRRRFLILASGWVFFGAGTARAEDPLQLLLDSVNPPVSYQGEQVTHVEGAPPNVLQRQRVYRKGNVLRIEYRNGQVLLDDGTTSQLYLPRQNLVEKGPTRFDPNRTRKIRQAVRLGRTVLELQPEGEVAGRPAFVLTVRDRNQPQGRKVWIDKETHVQLRLDEVRPNGRGVSTYFTSITYRADVPADKLVLGAPPDAREVGPGEGRPLPLPRAEALARPWGGLLLPRLVPAGYALKGFYRQSLKGRLGLVAVYTGAGPKDTLTVFQGPAMGMGSGPMVETRAGRLQAVSARKGDAEVTLVGPLPAEDLQRVLDSMSP